MKAVRIAVALSALNLLLLGAQVACHIPRAAAEDGVGAAGEALPALRARSLEIVDEQNRVRALLAVMPPTTVDGKDYPETVLLRLIDPKSGPVVKLTAAANGGALGLSDNSDGGVRLFAHDDDTRVEVVNREGRQKVMKP